MSDYSCPRIWICEKCKDDIPHGQECRIRPLNDVHIFCKRCLMINLAFPSSLKPSPALTDFVDEWNYIWHGGIEDKGLVWFKKARNKLIGKMDAFNKREGAEAERQKSQLIKRIDGWK